MVAIDHRRQRRMTEELAKTAVLESGAVSCSRCGSLAGESCKSPAGLPARSHKVRKRLALEITRDVTLGRLVPRGGVVKHDQPCGCRHCTGNVLWEFDR
jgi:hypothetical protein